MMHVLSSIIPLDIAATLSSPIIFALSIYLLSQKYHAKAKLAAFFMGAFIVSVFVSIIGFHLGNTIPDEGTPTDTQSLIDYALAALFFFLAYRGWNAKERKPKTDNNPKGKKIFKWFAIGLIGNATNLDGLFLMMTAAKEVGSAQDISSIVQVLLIGFNIFSYTLPITFPVILKVMFPRVATRVLSAISAFLKKYSRYIVSTIFLTFGILFIKRGLGL